jgi:nucleotide-binding universal stress UspA family protein
VHTILAAIDVSRVSQLAFKQALVLAHSMRAELFTVAVTPKYEGNMNRLSILDAERQLSSPFIQCLKDAASYAASLGMKIKTEHRVGAPSEEIVRLAEEIGASLVLLGSCHRSQMERVFLGRTAARVIAGSPCDVLLVPGGSEIHFRKILVGISGSPASLRAGERALQYGQSYSGQVHGVTAVDVPVERSLRYGVMNDAWQTGVEAQNAFSRLADNLGVPVMTSLKEDSPYACLIRYAKAKGIDLIVLGSHGHNWINDFVLGSVVERVASLAPCPVLVVNRMKSETESL